ncbi:MAG: GyrI-like domain-containing protein [Saprospiraceae bacterium]|nr:GyrI-like domain-containing protein [Saprospiraceae bacterium]
MNTKIEIRDVPKMNLAFVMSIGDPGLAGAYTKLINWMNSNKVNENENTKMMTIYHDNFKNTEPGNVRASACVILSEPIDVSGEGIDLKTNQGGKCIVGSFEIHPDDFEQSWKSLYLWMRENGYKNQLRIHLNYTTTILQNILIRNAWLNFIYQ